MKYSILMQILRRKAYVIHGTDEYYALVSYTNEHGEEDYVPLPVLPKIVQMIAKGILPQRGVRGMNFHFVCQFCGYQSFYGLRGDPCPECGEYIPKSDEWTWESLRASDAFIISGEFYNLHLGYEELVLKRMKIDGKAIASPEEVEILRMEEELQHKKNLQEIRDLEVAGWDTF